MKRRAKRVGKTGDPLLMVFPVPQKPASFRAGVVGCKTGVETKGVQETWTNQYNNERSAGVPEQVIITPTDNGPLQVRGRFKIVLPSGQALETGEETWLCRCGASQTKPFCDGTHSQIGFAAASVATPEVEADDSTFQAVAEVDVVGEGTLLGVEVAGQRMVLGRIDGEIYAIGGTCTHRDAPLAEGTLEDGVVLCPYHQGGFNLKTGSAVRRPVKVPVPRYDVKVEGHQILVSRQPTSRETS